MRNNAMNPEIAQKINELKNDRLHGASWLSVQAINLLSLTVKASQADTIADFLNELKMIAAAIIESRPNMTSIANYTSQFLNQLINLSQSQKHLDYVKNTAQVKINELIKFAQEITLKTAGHGAEMINDQDTIMTCSYSSTVCKTLEIAKERAIKFQVIIAESRYKENAYGEISAQQLRQHKIPTTVIRDQDMNRYVNKANKALVGADTILADGSLINGKPSYKLARTASLARIPFCSTCETAKIDVQDYHGKKPLLEPGFDLIPSDLITIFITEIGIIKPSDITNYISRYH
jgi:translation initiation factor 2B subunit (eIF-2B alpha/beta/delta family)